jgi:hypothetical protein
MSGTPKDSGSANWSTPGRDRLGSFLWAALPALSFILQLWLSQRAGTEGIFMRHPTVTIVDWVLMPFNYFAVRTIDWTRGVAMFVVSIIALVLNAATHAYWGYAHLDPGHMITSMGVILPAGWVHLVFSSVETSLMIAFVFIGRVGVDRRLARGFAILYFLLMAIAGYRIQGRFMLSDVVASMTGLLFVTVYAGFRYRSRYSEREHRGV